MPGQSSRSRAYSVLSSVVFGLSALIGTSAASPPGAVAAEPGSGTLEIQALACPDDGGGGRVEVIRYGPSQVSPLSNSADYADCMPAAFIEFGVYTLAWEFVANVVTDESGIAEMDLPEGDYRLTSDFGGGVGEGFQIVDQHLTVLTIIAYAGEVQEFGTLEVFAYECLSAEASVTFVHAGDPVPDVSGCNLGLSTFTLSDGASSRSFDVVHQ
ncbi:MAG TPA: hypothetical protein VM253_05935, partial [Candidatus Limnocylindrales bacterium]|nr:hypothetical protein [Candidatus Limnocylindrales bacterium]